MKAMRLGIALVLLLVGSVGAAWAKSAKITRMYVFGDSYSDIGEGYLDGNGPTAVAYLARRLGFELYPSNVADVAGKSLDYAVSGAQSGSGTGRKVKDALLGYGMQNQVADFAAKVKSHAIEFDPATTLFYIAGGLNDGRLPDGTTAANEKDEIRTLYGLGARRFAVALLTTEIPGFGVTGRRINPALEKIPAELLPELKDARIDLSHWECFMTRCCCIRRSMGSPIRRMLVREGRSPMRIRLLALRRRSITSTTRGTLLRLRIRWWGTSCLRRLPGIEPGCFCGLSENAKATEKYGNLFAARWTV